MEDNVFVFSNNEYAYVDCADMCIKKGVVSIQINGVAVDHDRDTQRPFAAMYSMSADDADCINLVPLLNAALFENFSYSSAAHLGSPNLLRVDLTMPDGHSNRFFFLAFHAVDAGS